MYLDETVRSGTDAPAEAEGRYVRAAEILRSLTEESDDRRSQQLLWSVYSNLSGLLAESDSARAVQYARQALDSQMAALELDRGNAKLATQVIATLNTLGEAHQKNDQTS